MVYYQENCVSVKGEQLNKENEIISQFRCQKQLASEHRGNTAFSIAGY